MTARRRFWIGALAGLCCAVVQAETAPDFQAEIRPILKKCLACHGPDEEARQANLRLDTRAGSTGKDGGYAGIIPGNSAESRVVARITHPDNPMPPTGERLSEAEIERMKKWIDAGALYERHWAFEKPQRPQLPRVNNKSWPRNEIDYFVLARLEDEGLEPSPQAGRHTLIRRLALDLTGLPPEPEEVEAFLSDESPKAYEKLVHHYFNSPRYGERWARVWLDLARYADSQGYEKDRLRTIWPYRDWVIRALNGNMPFDRFTIVQLAGDLLPVPTEDQLVATGFHRNTMTNTEGGTDDEEFRDAAVKDRVATTGQVWMGLTVGCAQCHSHKYDPVKHEDFYKLYAFFNQTADSDKPDDRPRLKLGNALSTPIFSELPPDKRRTTHIHERGSFLNPGEEVQPGIPEAFHPFPKDAPKNRLGLAKWLVSKNNPLTARVMVNRLWARLFGIGIVETEEDFGTQGLPPSHPRLLDWLATEFIALDWDVKGILKKMVMSATYRQASEVSPELYKKDPRNRLLARGARFRLPAEAVRDQALAVSGLLSPKMYGPPVMPWQPPGIWQTVYSDARWITSKGEDRYRRSLYTLWRRTSPYPSSIMFDAPTGEICTLRRVRTNTPLQALVTLNDPVLMEAAQNLALRTLSEAEPCVRERAEHMFRLVLVRPPEEAEMQRILKLQREAWQELKDDRERALELLHYHRVLYKEGRTVSVVDDTRGDPPLWRYTFEDPGDGWTAPKYDASGWNSGKGAFGRLPDSDGGGESPSEIQIATPWEGDALWLRREFDLPEEGLSDFRLQIQMLAGYEVYVNGVLARASLEPTGVHTPYSLYPEAEAALRPGKNVLAVYAHRIGEKDGRRHVDVGLTALRPPEFGPPPEDLADRAAWVVVANVILNLDETLTKR